MVKTTTFSNINWGKCDGIDVKIIEEYSESNDYIGCDVEVNGRHAASNICTNDAVLDALGDEVGVWIINHMGGHMKYMSIYDLTAEEVERTEYRPLDRETFGIATEAGWDYGDVLQNQGFACELVHETYDLKIWHETDTDRYVAEIK